MIKVFGLTFFLSAAATLTSLEVEVVTTLRKNSDLCATLIDDSIL